MQIVSNKIVGKPISTVVLACGKNGSNSVGEKKSPAKENKQNGRHIEDRNLNEGE